MQPKIVTESLSRFSMMDIACDSDAVALSFDDSSANGRIVGTVCKAPSVAPLKGLSYLSWGEIDQIGLSGRTREIFALGVQEKDHMKNGFVTVRQIIGSSHDGLADGTGEAPLFWDMIRVYNEDWSWSDESTDCDGYGASVVGHRLDTEFFSLCSNELQAVIESVAKPTGASDRSREIIKSVCKIWFKSGKELYGHCFYSMPGKGYWYGYYKQEDVPYYKEDGDGNRHYSLLRSLCCDASDAFCGMSTSGSAGTGNTKGSFGLTPALGS